jgi:hypothetical protein
VKQISIRISYSPGQTTNSKTTRTPQSSGEVMTDKTFLIRFNLPEPRIQSVIAAWAEIQGEHLVLLNAEGKLAALFLMEVVESWSEMET